MALFRESCDQLNVEERDTYKTASLSVRIVGGCCLQCLLRLW